MAQPKDFRVGIVFPQTEIGNDPLKIRDFAQTAEQLGFKEIVAYDHVLGANPASRPGYDRPYSLHSAFHEPFVLFAYLAGQTKTIRLTPSVIILPQRQTALVAKQAAAIDVLSGGRFTLGVGIGWNEVEYEALGVPFKARGKRLDDQIRVLRRLWTEPTLTEDGPFHRITDAGLNPLPIQKPIPIWIGGVSEGAIQRAAKLGNGWFPIGAPNKAAEVLGMMSAAVKNAGRKEEDVPSVANVPIARGGQINLKGLPAEVDAWRKAGAAGVVINVMGAGLKPPDGHIAILREIADTLQLAKSAR